ncbi:hypothetical protein ABT167_27385 [Streptomyces sp. NPDC001792]|uniref:hypothetical protein n=1 Tax=Streptomyces sp. NPDC001792 TaxID=3154524 RepID=UPI00331DF2D6
MQLTYTGDEGRYYPTLGLAPVPGETYDLPENPGDGNWDAAKTQVKKAGRAPEKDEA